MSKHDDLRDRILLEQIFENQLSIVGKTSKDILDEENYRFNWTITRKEFEKFKYESIFLIQKKLKINKRKAAESFNWFNRNYGLRIKD